MADGPLQSFSVRRLTEQKGQKAFTEDLTSNPDASEIHAHVS